MVFCKKGNPRKNKIKYLYLFSLIILSCTLASCDKNRVFEQNREIRDAIWNRTDKIKFSVEITDTVSPHNLYVNIRNTSEYPFRNIYLFITTSSKGIIVKDTFEGILADEKGKWLGSGLGDIWDNTMAYKKNMRFPHTGTYSFEFEQAMRNENLPFIMDVGLRIEHANSQ